MGRTHVKLRSKFLTTVLCYYGEPELHSRVASRRGTRYPKRTTPRCSMEGRRGCRSRRMCAERDRRARDKANVRRGDRVKFFFQLDAPVHVARDTPPMLLSRADALKIALTDDHAAGRVAAQGGAGEHDAEERGRARARRCVGSSRRVPGCGPAARFGGME